MSSSERRDEEDNSHRFLIEITKIQREVSFSELVDLGHKLWEIEPGKIRGAILWFIQSQQSHPVVVPVKSEALFYPPNRYIDDNCVSIPELVSSTELHIPMLACMTLCNQYQEEIFSRMGCAPDQIIKITPIMDRQFIVIPHRLYWMIRCVSAAGRDYDVITQEETLRHLDPVVNTMAKVVEARTRTVAKEASREALEEFLDDPRFTSKLADTMTKVLGQMASKK